MALSDAILAVRDWVVSGVQTAWPDVLVTSEPVPGDVGVGLASVEVMEIEFVPGTLLQDEADVRFVVACRFAVGTGSVDDARVVRAGVLRDTLSPLGSAGGYGYLSSVRGFTIRDLMTTDLDFTVRTEFVCRIVAARS